MTKSNYEQIHDLLEASKKDAEKFFNKGNKAAGTRLRQSMSDISKLCFEVRKDVQAIKHGSDASESSDEKQEVSEF